MGEEVFRRFQHQLPDRLGDEAMTEGLAVARPSIPQTFIIGRGKIVRHFVGFSPRLIPQMKAAIEEAASAG